MYDFVRVTITNMRGLEVDQFVLYSTELGQESADIAQGVRDQCASYYKLEEIRRER